jgi:hypothetical protein
MKLTKGMNAAYLMAAIICAAIIASMSCPSAATDDYTNLVKLITDSEDVRIDTQDLAFLLVTHGFDATPEESYESYAIVKLDKKIYEVRPNGVKPGLADVAILE